MVKYMEKARWEKVNILYTMFSLFRCPECGDINKPTSFCPTCGAMMGDERR